MSGLYFLSWTRTAKKTEENSNNGYDTAPQRDTTLAKALPVHVQVADPPLRGTGHTMLRPGRMRRENGSRSTGAEQAASASVLFSEWIILVGGKAARSKEEQVNYVRRDCKWNQLQNDRNEDSRDLGRKRPPRQESVLRLPGLGLHLGAAHLC